jgi:hypothetical protein
VTTNATAHAYWHGVISTNDETRIVDVHMQDRCVWCLNLNPANVWSDSQSLSCWAFQTQIWEADRAMSTSRLTSCPTDSRYGAEPLFDSVILKKRNAGPLCNRKVLNRTTTFFFILRYLSVIHIFIICFYVMHFNIILFCTYLGARCSLVVKALRYKPEGRGFVTRWGIFLNSPNPSGRARLWGLLSL